MYVDNFPNKLETEGIIVEVWKKSGDAYSEFVEKKIFDINAAKSATYFQYTFKTGGDYKITVFSKEGKVINSGYASVEMKDDNNVSSSDYYAGSKVYFTNEVDESADTSTSLVK